MPTPFDPGYGDEPFRTLDDCRYQIQKEDGQIAHGPILARSRSAQQTLTDCGLRQSQATHSRNECHLQWSAM